jgi:tRNA threonylcarbamoyl adenosine modification protein (Sua5/YciO/YrdC/YwlC family)
VRTFGEHDLDELASLLRRSHVAAIPTDTVYGLAAAPSSARAVEAIYRLKGRPSSLALPVLAATLDDVLALLGQLPPVAVTLARQFWPGALTLVVDAPAELARMVGSETDTIGLRVPALELTRRLLARSGPLAVTSANIHGEPPCTSAAGVRAAFSGAPELVGVLDGGPSATTPSTVVAVRGELIEVLRPGAIADEDLRAALA